MTYDRALTLGLWAMFWIGFVGGGLVFGSYYSSKADRIEAQAQERIAAQEKESYEIYAKQQDALMDALAQRDKALASVRSLRADAGRLRDQLSARAEADKARDSGDGVGERLAGCERLLAEGVGLVGEGAELSARVSADKDALAAVLK